MTELAGTLKKYVDQGHGTSLSDVNQHGDKGLAPLHLAARAGIIDDVRVLLEHGADANLQVIWPDSGAKVDTALHIAARRGDCAMLKLLLAHGADCKVNVGRTALHDAANRECILALVEAGADVNATDKGGETPLHRVATNIRFHDRMPYAELKKCVTTLLDSGAEINAVASDGETPLLSVLSLMEYIRSEGKLSDSDLRHCFSTLSLLLQRGADATVKSYYETALQFNLDERVDYEAKRMLLEHGADVNALSDEGYEYDNGWPPLHKAVRAGNVEVVRMLLAAGADVSATSRPARPARADRSDGYTALHIAATFDSPTDIAEMLLEHGADLEHRNSYGRTALLQAAFSDSYEHAKLFLEHGTDVNAIESQAKRHSAGDTALHIVLKEHAMDDVEKEAFIQLLLEHGADVNALDRRGEPVLCKAVRWANARIIRVDANRRIVGVGAVKMLLDAGADASIANSDGKTAVDMAQDDPEIAELIAQHAARPSHVAAASPPRRKGLKATAEAGGKRRGGKMHDGKRQDDKALAPAHSAAAFGHADKLKALAEKGADLNATSGEGVAPLHYAVIGVRANKTPCAQMKECVAILLEHGAEVNAVSPDGRTPLLHLLSLMRSYDPELSDSDMEHTLSTLSLLLQHGADANARSSASAPDGLQHVLDKRVDCEAKRMLLAHGADVNAAGHSRLRWRALHRAVQAGSAEVGQMLREAGANVGARLLPSVGTGDGDAAIHIAADLNKDTVIAELLLEHGADLKQRGRYQNTSLLSAVRAESLEHAKLFLERGADVNAINATEALPPGLASWELASQLEDPPSVDDDESRRTTDSEGGTALHNVFFYVDDVAEVAVFIKLLLAHGANINARCLSGETPLGKAVRLATVGHYSVSPEIIKLLLDSGADVNVTDYHGNTIMDWTKGYPEVAGLLAKHAAGGG